MATAFAEVVPLSRLPRTLGVFDYRVPPGLQGTIGVGSLVIAPFRSSELTAIVVDLKAKSAIAPNRTRELSGIAYPDVRLTRTQLELARTISRRYRTSLATTVKMFVPPLRKRGGEPSSNDGQRTDAVPRRTAGPPPERPTLITPKTAAERERTLTDLLSRAASRNEHTLLLFPTVRDASRLCRTAPGASKPTLFTTDLADRERLEAWLAVRRGVAKVVVGTRIAITLPFPKLDAIVVVDDADSNHKEREQSPRFDSRWVSRWLSERFGAHRVVVSASPSVEQWYESKENRWIVERQPSPTHPRVIVTDIREERRAGNFSPIPASLESAIEQALTANRHTLLIMNRRGFARSVSCSDCGHLARCRNCGMPLVSHGDEQAGKLSCHRCGTIAELPPFCPHCGGSRFRYHGVGTERLELEVRKRFPKAVVSRVERSLAPNDAADITVGTSAAIDVAPWQRTALAAVWPDADLLTDFRAGERVYVLLNEILARLPGGGRLAIETSAPDNPAIDATVRGQPERFYDHELDDRKTFRFPPFVELITATLERHDRRGAAKEREKLESALRPALSKILNASLHPLDPRPHRRGRIAVGILMKIPPLTPETQVDELLSLIPHPWTVDRDPAELA